MARPSISRDIAASVRLALKDFEIEPGLVDGLVGTEWSHRYEVPGTDLPVPELVYFLLVRALNLPSFGPFEKIRWVIPFRFQGIPCTIAYEKFGMCLYLFKDAGDEASCRECTKEILGKIRRTSQSLEQKVLAPFAKQQTQLGNVVVINHYYRFRQMYEYFRNRACEAFRGIGDLSNPVGFDEAIGLLNRRGNLAHEGFHNTIAMVDAYFSLLEHLFVLILGWADYRPESDDFLAYIGDTWANKYQRLFHIHRDKKAKHYYDRLKDIKERLRNTFAHGGFEKNGASLRFFLPGIGTVPLQLSGAGKTQSLRFMPVEEEDFASVTKTFDEFDEWLAHGKYQFAMKYAQTALNLPVDGKSRTEHRRVSRSESVFKDWIEHMEGLATMHANMDY